jgi:hypothetical protein
MQMAEILSWAFAWAFSGFGGHGDETIAHRVATIGEFKRPDL